MRLVVADIEAELSHEEGAELSGDCQEPELSSADVEALVHDELIEALMQEPPPLYRPPSIAAAARPRGPAHREVS